MSMLSYALVGLAAVAFLLAVYVSLLGPLFNIPAESFSRASSNLALIAIAMLICLKQGAKT